MTTLWTTIKKYASQVGLTYNESGKTYNQAYTNYNGKLSTVWSNQTKN
jgi:hypothetical protein